VTARRERILGRQDINGHDRAVVGGEPDRTPPRRDLRDSDHAGFGQAPV
jgi:hypothetical protein